MFKNNVKTEKYGNCHHALNRSLQVHRYGSCFFLILGNIEVLVLIIRTEIDSREAYSCKRLVRIYFGSLKQTLIASFSIPCRRDSCVLGAAMKAILPYSIIGLTYTLYSFMSVFASVPLFDRTRSTFNRFVARLLMESICFFK